MAESKAQSLIDELAAVLPKDHQFTIHHISTPPTKCEAIYSSPPNTRPDRTYRESHFLQVSVPTSPSAESGSSSSGTSVFVLAIECLIYTTRHLTTIFVSKADSTGYLSCLKLGGKWDSPLRSVATTFVRYLVKHRMRPGTKLVVDLFARASDQYLYPGSVENANKHVSDDRQLIKWWCRVLIPIVQSYAPRPEPRGLFDTTSKTANGTNTDHTSETTTAVTTAQAYLLVPGEETITTFFPPLMRLNAQARVRWTHGHPLATLSRHAGAPPRCLIPHFPDDPKGRYLVELDDELPDSNAASQAGAAQDVSPSKRGTGEWKSVKSLDQFWEMMAFRSECSSGRLVGFLWIVFEPPGSDAPALQEEDSQESLTSSSTRPASDAITPIKQRDHKPSKRAGKIPPLLPRILRPSASSFTHVPSTTPWFHWSEASRAPIVLADAAYAKATEVLLRLDFATLQVAVASTRTWVSEVAVLAGMESGDGSQAAGWGDVIIGTAEPKPGSGAFDAAAGTAAAGVNVMLGVKRKRDVAALPSEAGPGVKSEEAGLASEQQQQQQAPAVNVLGVRKKPKKVQPVSITSPT